MTWQQEAERAIKGGSQTLQATATATYPALPATVTCDYKLTAALFQG